MSASESSLKEYFTLDHRRCDSIWAEIEGAAEGDSRSDIPGLWQRFDAAMRRHLAMEEEVLFPAFEQATGMTGGGPTFVMRSEHEQMRGLLEQMSSVVGAGDFDEFLDLGDTLLMLIQQHNQKEEHMLYPMAEQALAADWGALAENLGRYPS
jgi:hemerythrin-like domain-containing protein